MQGHLNVAPMLDAFWCESCQLWFSAIDWMQNKEGDELHIWSAWPVHAKTKPLCPHCGKQGR